MSSSPSPLDSTCKPHHDWFTAALTFGLCCGLVISYVPQHYRIISTRSSEGLSPWFLLLGTTSSAAGMLNMFTMQWGIIRCCRVLSFGSCLEMTAGVVQVGLQWVMFTLIFVLYIVYYPPHLKYLQRDVDDPMVGIKKGKRTKEWKTSVVLSGVAIVHFFISLLTTLFLLLTFPPSPSPTPSPSPEPIPFPSPNPDGPEHISHSVQQWATFLGVSSAILAAIQYVPQIAHTARHKVVGALSIPMMCIQTPGAVLMVLSIALRPSTNWTSWITFAVAGIMQGTLLVMCICWKVRQSKLGLDDFGNPLHGHGHPDSGATYDATTQVAPIPAHPAAEIDVPGLRLSSSSSASISTTSTASTEEEEQKAKRKATQIALANALESAVESDILSAGEGVGEAREIPIEVDEAGTEERTPLLRDGRRMRRSVVGGGGDDSKGESSGGGGGWFGWRR